MRRFSRRSLTVVVSAVALAPAVLAGCGEDKKKGPTPPPFATLAPKDAGALNAAAVLSATDAWAAGQSLLHFDGKVWKSLSLPEGATIFALYSAGDTAWAVGSRGAIVELKGGAATPLRAEPRETLRAICGSGAGDIWAFGEGGLALHRSAADGTWDPADVPVPQTVKGCHIEPDGRGLLYGTDSSLGTVTVQLSGGTWTDKPRTGSGFSAIEDVVVMSGSDAYPGAIYGVGADTAGNGVLGEWGDRWSVKAQQLGGHALSVYRADEGLWIGGTGHLTLVDPADFSDRSPMQFAGNIWDIAGVDTLIVAVGEVDGSGRILFRQF